MADNNEDTQVSEPEVTDVTEETSTTEETQDTDVEESLEEDETTFDDETEESEDDEDESADSGDKDTEPVESEEESEEDAEPSESDQSEEDSSNDQEEDTASKEDQKAYNAEMARRRIAEKQAREIEKQKQQEAYLQAAEDAKDLALRQLQVDAYNNRVEKNVNNLTNGLEKAVANIDLFRTGTPEVREELVRRLEAFERQNVQYDANGDPVVVNGDVYEYLKNEADSIQKILATGARNQVKEKAKVKARAQTLPTRAPKEPAVDPDLEAFDEEAKKWL